MGLPITLPYELHLTAWAAILNPIVDNPILKGRAISSITLIASTPKAIPTGLGRVNQGWFLLDNTAFCSVKRTEAFNATSLTLESNVDTTISIWVY